jgi:hypothetical protein
MAVFDLTQPFSRLYTMIFMGGTEIKKKSFVGLIPGVPHSGTEPVKIKIFFFLKKTCMFVKN